MFYFYFYDYDWVRYIGGFGIVVIDFIKLEIVC